MKTAFNWTSVTPDNIPPALKEQRRWVYWKPVERRQGKVDKVPCTVDGTPVSWTVEDSWLSFDEAIQFRRDGLGIGFVMNGIHDDPLCEPLVAIDLDKCVQFGELGKQAQDIVARCKTYWEFSPSGSGLRAFCFGEIPNNVSNLDAGVEIYDGTKSRFLTVTGNCLAPNKDVQRVNGALQELVETYGKSSTSEDYVTSDIPEPLSEIPDRPAGLQIIGKLVDAVDVLDRSAAWYSDMVLLFRHGWTAEQVFSLAADGATLHAAAEHRGGDFERAIALLWRDTQKAQAYVGRVTASPEDFDDVSAESHDKPRWVDAHSWQGVEPPEREWIVNGWIPRGVVTLLYADGGIGKSMMSQDLATARALGQQWMGLDVLPGKTFAVMCEDSEDELHRRQNWLTTKYGAHPDKDTVWLASRVGHNNILMSFDSLIGRLHKDPDSVYQLIHDGCKALQPELLILDTAADLFGGEENRRIEVRQFLNVLARIAEQYNLAILLLAHPSVDGMRSGRGSGGSTAWSNTVRSRLYLERDPHPGSEIRYLSRKKANYSGLDGDIRMIWREHCLWHDGDIRADEFFEEAESDMRGLFMQYLTECVERDETVSASPQSGAHYYATKFVKYAKKDGIKVLADDFKDAFTALMRAGDITEKEVRTRDRKLRLAIFPVTEDTSSDAS